MLDPEMLKEFHIIAMRTIEVLNRNMIMGDAPLSRIFAYYKECSR